MHNKNNLHDWFIHPQEQESCTESIFTGLLFLGTVAVVLAIYVLALKGAI